MKKIIKYKPDEVHTEKKPYKKPELKRLGDMRVMTQGAFSGTNDPGGPQNAKFPRT